MIRDYRLSDLLDLSLIQRLADSNFAATGLPMSLIDALDNSVLVRAGWTDMCMNFHRAHPASNRRCLESASAAKDHLVEGEAYQYKCKNGLWHVAIPILVTGRHLATMFLSQFFFEDEIPEREYFSQQSREFGCDLEGYLAGLDKVPLFSRDKLDYIIAYNKALVRFIADLAEQSLQLNQANEEQKELDRKRTAELAKTNEFLENIFDNNADAVGISDRHGNLTKWNKAAEEMYGYTFAELQGKPGFDLYADKAELAKMLSQLRRDGFLKRYPIDMRKKDGSTFPCSLSVKVLRDADQKTIGSVTVSRDLTETRKNLAKINLANEKLQVLVAEADQRNRHMTLLQEMNELFQMCQNSKETYDAIAHFGPKFFPGYTGALYLLNNSENFFEMEASWGEPSALELVFGPDDCWALRRSRVYLVNDPKTSMNCPHLSASLPSGYLCLPMMAQGKALGILHLQKLSPRQTEGLEVIEQYARTVAEAMAMALANLKLREIMRNQAIRDSLTGLFNRRYLEETLERELSRCQRLGITTGVIMMDLDHFKEYNDTFGHNAGDELLVALGRLIQNHIRQEDIACRYGGEEFLLVMPGASLAIVLERVNDLVQSVKLLHQQSQSLNPTTISAGVAIFPTHASSSKEIVRVADAALYRAKAEGRDRVVVASEEEQALPRFMSGK